MLRKEIPISCFAEWTPIILIYGVKMTMKIIINRNMKPQDRARLDNATAAAERNAANIDYLAMMSDIDIPTEEGYDNESEV